MIQHKDFHRQTRKMLSVYSKEATDKTINWLVFYLWFSQSHTGLKLAAFTSSAYHQVDNIEVLNIFTEIMIGA